ncbi:MAG: amino acid permease [Gemmataceae bacterium]|nr:amino acid permease [Gemmataceae bacterium]
MSERSPESEGGASWEEHVRAADLPREGPTAGEPAPSGFQQKLGLFDATTLVAGTMIGSGIFIVSADIARDVGSSGWLMLVWVLTGVMTIIGALSYAELAAMMPNAGGQYVYLRESYSPLWGFLYGWTCFLVIQTGSIAAVGVAFARFLGVLVPVLGTENVLWSVSKEDFSVDLSFYVPWMGESLSFFKREGFHISAGHLVAVGVIALLTYVNCRGVESGKWVQNLFTIAKTLGLLLLIVLGLTVAVNHEAVAENLGNIWGGMPETAQFQKVSGFIPVAAVAVVMVISGAMVGSLFSADAWNNVTFTAGEIKNPRRNLPWSLALGTGLVIVLYLLANLAYLAVLPVRGDKAATLDLTAKAKEHDAKAALLEAGAWRLQAEAARLEARAHRARKEEATAKLLAKEAEDKTKNAGEILKEAAGERQQAQETRREATFTAGIDGAREDRVGTAVLEQASPNFGVPIMALAIMISTFGCVNGMILMGARLYYAMGQDRLFFQSVGRLNRQGVPAVGLVLQGIWSVLLVFSGSYSELLDYVIWAALFFYVLTVTGLFILRRKMPDAPRPYRAFGYPVIPALYVLLCAVIMVSLLVVKPVYSWPSFLIVLTGIPVYFLWRGRARTTP